MQLGISARIKPLSVRTKVETRRCTRFLINRCRVWRIFVGLFVQVTKPDDITSSLYGWFSRSSRKINVGLMALGVENEIKKQAPEWTCNQPDKGVYYYHNRAAGRHRFSSAFLTVFLPNTKHAGVSAHNCNVSAPSVTWAYMRKRMECVSVLINRYFT